MFRVALYTVIPLSQGDRVCLEEDLSFRVAQWTSSDGPGVLLPSERECLTAAGHSAQQIGFIANGPGGGLCPNLASGLLPCAPWASVLILRLAACTVRGGTMMMTMMMMMMIL